MFIYDCLNLSFSSRSRERRRSRSRSRERHSHHDHHHSDSRKQSSAPSMVDVEVNNIYRGSVTGVVDFGCFVSLEESPSGAKIRERREGSFAIFIFLVLRISVF